MSARLADVVADLQERGLFLDASTLGKALVLDDVEHDSRKVRPGSLFCCVSGTNFDGHQFIADAEKEGAVAVLVSREVATTLPLIRVSDVRRGMAFAAATVHRHPSAEMPIFGVTGTNGKTTTAIFLGAILAAAGHSPRVIGTLSGERTTPESTELQRILREAKTAGSKAAVMEVTSHAMVLDRVVGMNFACVIFTNLGHDHLDFHGTLDSYFNAKASLFSPEYARFIVVNRDDSWGQVLLKRAEKVFSPEQIHTSSLSDVLNLSTTLDGSNFIWRGNEVNLSVGGVFNVSNALSAATAAAAFGISHGHIVAGLSSVVSVPGRVERVPSSLPFSTYVDFAHTPDSLDAVLSAARESTKGGRVIVVFGCGGDRDVEKRPAMGAVAARRADKVYLTSDNSRSEDPMSIISQIRAGMMSDVEIEIEIDRRIAINAAIEAAHAGDVVIVAGKGHETGQSSAGAMRSFSDVEEVRKALMKRESSSS